MIRDTPPLVDTEVLQYELGGSECAVAIAERGPDTIIAEADTSIETLTVHDAVMHMDLAYQQVLMFRNKKSGHFNVIYRRPDGHIGWIDPAAV